MCVLRTHLSYLLICLYACLIYLYVYIDHVVFNARQLNKFKTVGSTLKFTSEFQTNLHMSTEL